MPVRACEYGEERIVKLLHPPEAHRERTRATDPNEEAALCIPLKDGPIQTSPLEGRRLTLLKRAVCRCFPIETRIRNCSGASTAAHRQVGPMLAVDERQRAVKFY